MDVAAILALIGSVALLAGVIGGGIEAKEIKIPPLPRWSRIASGAVGFVFIGLAIWITFHKPPIDPDKTVTQIVQPTGPATPQVTHSTSAVLDIFMESIQGCTVHISGFTVSSSGKELTFEWGDGNYSKGFFDQTHTYAASGTYTLTVTLPGDELSRTLTYAVVCAEPTVMIEPSLTPLPSPGVSTGAWLLAQRNPDLNIRGMQVVYDTSRGIAVLFGGAGEEGTRAETWEFAGENWVQVITTHAPPDRKWFGMVYDTERKVTVLFGGYQVPHPNGENGNLGDMWEYDGTDWQEIILEVAPSPRWAQGMAYDSCNNKIILFGGKGGGLRNDIWEFAAGQWMQVDTATSPPVRDGAVLVFDKRRCRTVLFGGEADGLVALDDTWEYYDLDWHLVVTSVSPAPRWLAMAAYHPAKGALVLYGGYGPAYPGGGATEDTWEYNGQEWKLMAMGKTPGESEQQALFYDARNNRLTFFGNGETWVLK